MNLLIGADIPSAIAIPWGHDGGSVWNVGFTPNSRLHRLDQRPATAVVGILSPEGPSASLAMLKDAIFGSNTDGQRESLTNCLNWRPI
jgi:hypothetical protein